MIYKGDFNKKNYQKIMKKKLPHLFCLPQKKSGYFKSVLCTEPTLSMCKALGFITNAGKKERERKEREGEEGGRGGGVEGGRGQREQMGFQKKY